MADKEISRAVRGGFAEIRKADAPAVFGKIPTDAEVLRDKKIPHGPHQFWKHLTAIPGAPTLPALKPYNLEDGTCVKLLNRLIKKFGMARMLELGEYYVKHWMELKNAYRWQANASAKQFVLFIYKIDFCQTNGIPLSPANRVTGNEDYDSDKLMEAFKKMAKPSGNK